jgi:hypothetical protein
MTDVQKMIISLKIWRGITLMLAALLTGTTFEHTLEMPAKLKVDGPRWLTFQYTFYPAFASIVDRSRLARSRPTRCSRSWFASAGRPSG